MQYKYSPKNDLIHLSMLSETIEIQIHGTMLESHFTRNYFLWQSETSYHAMRLTGLPLNI